MPKVTVLTGVYNGERHLGDTMDSVLGQTHADFEYILVDDASTDGSRAMLADAFQTTACWWLSLATLVDVGSNGLFGWWWADPLAALVISGLIVKEGREAWAGERECC